MEKHLLIKGFQERLLFAYCLNKQRQFKLQPSEVETSISLASIDRQGSLNPQVNKNYPLASVVAFLSQTRNEIQLDKIADTLTSSADIPFSAANLVVRLAQGDKLRDPTYFEDESATSSDASLANLPFYLIMDPKFDAAHRRRLESLVSTFTRKLGIGKVSTWQDFQRVLHWGHVLPQKVMLRDSPRFVSRAQANFWSIVGADLFNFLRCLLDPTYSFSQSEILAGIELSRLWGVEQFANKLLLLRAINDYEAEKNYFSTYLPKVDSVGLPKEIWPNLLSGKFNEKSLLKIATAKTADKLEIQIALSALISQAIKNRSLTSFTRLLLLSYENDDGAYLFLDWLSVHRTFRFHAAESDIYTMFINELKSSPILISRFKRLAVGVGTGQGSGKLDAYIISYVSRLRSTTRPPGRRNKKPTFYKDKRNPLKRLVEDLRRLPENAQSRMLNTIIAPSTIAKVARAFPSSPKWAGVMQLNSNLQDDFHCSTLRLDFIEAAEEKRILHKHEARILIEEETHRLRMLLFRNRFTSGRIRIDWHFLSGELKEILEKDLGPVLGYRDKPKFSKEALSTAASLVGNSIAKFVLFDSGTSLDQALSNNLRHGVVVTRFSKTFTDSIEEFQNLDGSASSAEDPTYHSLFGTEPGTRLIALRVKVLAVVESFKNYWLTIDRDGKFIRSLASSFTSVIDNAFIHQAVTTTQDILPMLIGEYRSQVDAYLRETRKSYETEVVAPCLKLIQEARSNIKGGSKEVSFLDSLEVNVGQAVEEVRSWIGLMESLGRDDGFSIHELLEFETSSLHHSNFKSAPIRLKGIVHSSSNSEPVILSQHTKLDMKYYDLFYEIIHNLLLNAYRESGLGADTEIQINITVSDDKTEIVCSNNFSSVRQKHIVEKIDKTERMMADDDISNSAVDSLSGYKKIRRVAGLVLGSRVEISVDRSNLKKRLFSSKITLNGTKGILLSA